MNPDIVGALLFTFDDYVRLRNLMAGRPWEANAIELLEDIRQLTHACRYRLVAIPEIKKLAILLSVQLRALGELFDPAGRGAHQTVAVELVRIANLFGHTTADRPGSTTISGSQGRLAWVCSAKLSKSEVTH